MTSFADDIRPLIEARNRLARDVEASYAVQVNEIIQEECRDSNRIGFLLDHMLTFCFDDQILTLYKKLCRYYFSINPESTAHYVYAYRDMWDDDYEPNPDSPGAVNS